MRPRNCLLLMIATIWVLIDSTGAQPISAPQQCKQQQQQRGIALEQARLAASLAAAAGARWAFLCHHQKGADLRLGGYRGCRVGEASHPGPPTQCRCGSALKGRNATIQDVSAPCQDCGDLTAYRAWIYGCPACFLITCKACNKQSAQAQRRWGTCRT